MRRECGRQAHAVQRGRPQPDGMCALGRFTHGLRGLAGRHYHPAARTGLPRQFQWHLGRRADGVGRGGADAAGQPQPDLAGCTAGSGTLGPAGGCRLAGMAQPARIVAALSPPLRFWRGGCAGRGEAGPAVVQCGRQRIGAPVRAVPEEGARRHSGTDSGHDRRSPGQHGQLRKHGGHQEQRQRRHRRERGRAGWAAVGHRHSGRLPHPAHRARGRADDGRVGQLPAPAPRPG